MVQAEGDKKSSSSRKVKKIRKLATLATDRLPRSHLGTLYPQLIPITGMDSTFIKADEELLSGCVWASLGMRELARKEVPGPKGEQRLSAVERSLLRTDRFVNRQADIEALSCRLQLQNWKSVNHSTV